MALRPRAPWHPRRLGCRRGSRRAQRRRLSQRRARRRGGRAAGDRRPGRGRHPGHPDRRHGRRGPRGARLRAPVARSRSVYHQLGLRQRRHAADDRRSAGPRVLRGPPHDRLVVVGVRRAARALARLVRPRRRGLGRQPLRRRDAGEGLPGARRLHPDPGDDAPRCGPRPGRYRPPGRVRLPFLVRLQQRRRSQEPGRRGRGVSPRLPRAAHGCVARPEVHQRRPSSRGGCRAGAGDRRARPTSCCATSSSTPISATC